jgi:thiol-disulfide isomerase/thioredoxin
MKLGRLNHVGAGTSGARRRRFRKRWLLYAVGLVLLPILATCVFLMWSFDNPLPPKLAAVEGIPVILPNGKHATLGGSIRPGVPTVISLWASWCEPCLREAPKIAELRRQFPPDKLNLVYMNVRDPYASSEDLAQYMSRFSMPADGYVVVDDQARLTDLTNGSKNPIPHTMVFGRAGEPLASIVGYKPLALSRVAGLVAN